MAPRWHAGQPADEPEPEQPKQKTSGRGCAGGGVLIGGLVLVLIGLALAYMIGR